MTSQEKYTLLDKLNVCHKCEKAKPFPGKKYCAECLEKIAEYNARHYDPKKSKEYQVRRREIYRKKKEQGICVRCSKPATYGLYCYECLIRVKRKNAAIAERRKRERHDMGLIPEQRQKQGLCLRCGKPADGGKYCPDCMAAMCAALDKGREKSPFREMEQKRLQKKFGGGT